MPSSACMADGRRFLPRTGGAIRSLDPPSPGIPSVHWGIPARARQARRSDAGNLSRRRDPGTRGPGPRDPPPRGKTGAGSRRHGLSRAFRRSSGRAEAAGTACLGHVRRGSRVPGSRRWRRTSTPRRALRPLAESALPREGAVRFLRMERREGPKTLARVGRTNARKRRTETPRAGQSESRRVGRSQPQTSECARAGEPPSRAGPRATTS